MKSKKTISFDAACLLAEKEAISMLSYYLKDKEGVRLLEKTFFEAEGCWMFFINKSLKFPPEAAFPASAAYAVSKEGEVRIVADLSDDPVRLERLLNLLSDYFCAARVENSKR